MERFEIYCPQMPAHFAERIEKTLDMLGENERVYRVSWKLIAIVCVIAVLISAVGFAAVKHDIFGWIFTRGNPDEVAESMVVEFNERFAGDNFDIVIEEYIFDGRDIYVSWSADVKAEGDYILIGSGLKCDEFEFMDVYLDSGLGNYQFVIDDERLISGMNKGHFYTDVTEDEINVSIMAALLKPCGDIGKYDNEFLMDWYSQHGEDIDSWDEKLELMEETGYGNLVEEMEIEFEINAQEEIQETIVEDEIIDILDFQVQLTEVSFTGVNAKIRWEYLCDDQEKYENIDYQIWIDGEDSGFACMRDEYSVEFWSEHGYTEKPDKFIVVPVYYIYEEGGRKVVEIEDERKEVLVKYD